MKAARLLPAIACAAYLVACGSAQPYTPLFTAPKECIAKCVTAYNACLGTCGPNEDSCMEACDESRRGCNSDCGPRPVMLSTWPERMPTVPPSN